MATAELPKTFIISTPTVLRIKRRLDEETSDTIVVSAKRKKEDSDVKTEIILAKVATIQPEEKIGPHLQKIFRNGPKLSLLLRDCYKRSSAMKLKDKVRKNVQNNRSTNFFKLTCSKRNIDFDTEEEISVSDEDKPVNFNFFDAAVDELAAKLQKQLNQEDVITCNGEPMEREKLKFVYDLYFTDAIVENSSWIDNICEIRSDPELLYDAISDDSSCSDDENDEDNYRNDYPDEDYANGGFIFEDEEDLLWQRMNAVRLNSDDSDESYDATSFSGDFDEEGNQVI